MARNRAGNRRSLTTLAVIAVTAPLLAACGVTLPNITGGLGGSSAANKSPTVSNDPASRAIQVGRISGRAQKCGFVFDANKLRTQFLMHESATLTDAAAIERIGKTYDVARNAVIKAIGSEARSYCTEVKTSQIKVALNRHLAGDYTPDAPEPVVEDAGWFGGGGSSTPNPASERLRNPEGPIHPSTAP